MSILKSIFLTSFCTAVLSGMSADIPPIKSRSIPAKSIPTPPTISQAMQLLDGSSFDSLARKLPGNKQEWYALIEIHKKYFQTQSVESARKLFPALVTQEIIGGVKTYTVIPDSFLNKNEDRLLINIHGGGYIFYGGEGCLPEAMAMAHYSKSKVMSIDYRMPPDHPFPAALDDVVSVYREILKTHRPQNIAFFGTSAGGGLAAAAMLKFSDLNLPLPAVASLGTPWSDLTKSGDTYFTNEDVDDMLVTYDGAMGGVALLYAGGEDLKNPLLSPVYGDFSKGFPPAILTSGTRDMFLSNTVRLFRNLRKAGIDAELQIFEGVPHAFYLAVFEAPESKDAFEEIVRFFEKHLPKQLSN